MITDYEWECIRDEIARQVGEIIDHLANVLSTLDKQERAWQERKEEEQR